MSAQLVFQALKRVSPLGFYRGEAVSDESNFLDEEMYLTFRVS